MPWNPATTTTLPSEICCSIRCVSIRKIRARVCAASVTMPTCAPVREIAGCPNSCNAILNRAMEICSPVESNISISRREGFDEISLANFTNPSVVFPIAETTTTTELPPCTVLRTRPATALMRSTDPTEDPPYFWTISAIILTHFYLKLAPNPRVALQLTFRCACGL